MGEMVARSWLIAMFHSVGAVSLTLLNTPYIYVLIYAKCHHVHSNGEICLSF